MDTQNKTRGKSRTGKEFYAGFVAGLVCLGIIALVLLLIFSL